MTFTQVNAQRTPKDWVVIALTSGYGVFIFRTENPFAANDKFNEIKTAGGFLMLALYNPARQLIHKET
jgi:hypothetical protein